MSVALKPCTTYRVEYGTELARGFEVDDFIDSLRELGEDGIWISDTEEDIEINKDIAKKLIDDKSIGKSVREIISRALEQADTQNDFIRLSVF